MLHQPVLLAASVAALAIKPDGIYIDGTFGRGGHSRAILSHLGPGGRLIAFDQDLAAIEAAGDLADDARFEIVHANFAEIHHYCEQAGLLGCIDGLFFDLGVSSPQLDEAARGFSFQHDGPLDMRMDQSRGETLADLLARISESALADVIYQYGEERCARRIARAIVAARAEAPITRTRQLAEIVQQVVPRSAKEKKHPATRTFQALRIALNRELDVLSTMLAECGSVLSAGGRWVVLSFHSLEDRLVKQAMMRLTQPPPVEDRLPIQHVEVEMPYMWVVKKHRPTLAEVAENPRARSVMLRAIEKRSD